MAQGSFFRKIFGFAFNGNVVPNLPTPVSPSNLDSAIDISATIGGGTTPFSAALDTEYIAKNENDLIEQYRNLAYVPEVDNAIEEIVSESVITDKKKETVSIDLDETGLPLNIQSILVDEHKEIMRLYGFNRRGYEMFKRWYVDGRMNYQVLIDENSPQDGIKELRFIDPRKIKRVRELIKELDPVTQVELIQGVKEYYLFNDKNVVDVRNSAGSMIMTRESVIHCNSGLHDPTTNVILSYLHPAIRPSNNLRAMEDAMVIYRLARAPERRVFKIYTGDLPKGKAEQYVQEIANKYRNKVVYDVNNGVITNDKRYHAMTEDYWLPVGDGSKGVGIETLPGGEAVGETAESEYFKKKLYDSLHVPSSRMSEQSPLFSSGTEVTRDEVRFSRFINRLRTRFSGLFIDALKRQCVLKGIMTEQEFSSIEESIKYKFAEDNYFSESVEYNIINQRMGVLQLVDPYVGKYVSKEYVFRNILQMSDEEAAEMQQQIEMDRQQMLMQEIQEQQARIEAGVADDPTTHQADIAESVSVNEQCTLSESDDQSELDAAAISILKQYGSFDD
jgi:Bacteriophage T4-like portal protein (Gp20)